jgi:hypothetical protein
MEEIMNRKIMMGIVAVLITGFLALPAMAKGSKWENGEKGPSKEAGKSNIGHLYLYEKTPDPALDPNLDAGLDPALDPNLDAGLDPALDPNLDAGLEPAFDSLLIVEGGMWGKMKYNLSGPTFDFVFNGHGLPIGQEYTLICYPGSGTGLICLGSGIVIGCEEDCIDGDSSGNIHIKGSVNTGDLPIEEDENYGNGARILLVPSSDIGCALSDVDYASSDVDCEMKEMKRWTEDANLYEGALITFDDTDE